MQVAGERQYSIGEVAERTGLSVHALRWFEREGLFPDQVERNSAGRRVFDDDVLYWITLCVKLRHTGMPIAKLKEFAALVKDGPGNEPERLLLLEQHEASVRQKIAELQDSLEVITEKAVRYRAHISAGTVRGVWEPDEQRRKALPESGNEQ
ncbi:MerR family transcriptional regulator [Psychromicrobium lacuslunae]|uniref:MerR family transcriptional regulator n=1 Tax=Psychromicrobium lacuslunae TaxID=1618207 RepID=UPI0005D3D93F|nr:MerR family transcriptional regulator [Psychromicrobium lacuslunae]